MVYNGIVLNLIAISVLVTYNGFRMLTVSIIAVTGMVFADASSYM